MGVYGVDEMILEEYERSWKGVEKLGNEVNEVRIEC